MFADADAWGDRQPTMAIGTTIRRIEAAGRMLCLRADCTRKANDDARVRSSLDLLERDDASNKCLRVEMPSRRRGVLSVCLSHPDEGLALLLLAVGRGARGRWRSPYRRKVHWACPGNKDLSPQEPSAVSSSPSRYRRGSCTSSRCAGACGCVSIKPGSPRVRTSSCSSSQAAILSHISGMLTFHQARCNPRSTRRGTMTSA